MQIEITKNKALSWLIITIVGACFAAAPCRAQDSHAVAFYETGTSKGQSFVAVDLTQEFDVANLSASYVMLVFEPNPNAKLFPHVVRLAPHARQTVQMTIEPGVDTFDLGYSIALADSPFRTDMDRYRAYNDGETDMFVPVPAALYSAMRTRAESILKDSRTLLTDPAMPPETYIYTAGPFYKAGGLFARDFLYTLEGAGRDDVTADEVKRAVDFLALKQLRDNRKVGNFTYAQGAIPDHVYPDGRYCWGPGAFYGDDTAHFHRPSMDEAMNFITLAWHYGYKAGWNAEWKSWFRANEEHFVKAWYSVPRNPHTGLITQWTTPGHLAGSGITETDGASVMWGFHDSYGFGGDDLGTSVLACNAARALADMFDHASDAASGIAWSATADAMQDSIRAQFNSAGYLPWGVGKMAPTMASPDITGYAVWSGILTKAQADAASDWFAARYEADKEAGGAADMFNMTPGLHGSVRMARKADDVTPGGHIWPNMTAPQWENLTYGYNAYQDGGYWYYMSMGVAATLWRKHPAEAEEWVAHAYADVTSDNGNNPYERIDGTKPVNNRYNASAGSLLGMGMPATISAIKVSITGSVRP